MRDFTGLLAKFADGSDPVPTTRPLTFLQRNRSALSGGALAALLGAGLGVALPSKGDTRRKRNIRRLVKAVLYASGFAVAGAGAGAVHDFASRGSRTNIRGVDFSEIGEATRWLNRLHRQAQQNYMHRHGGVPAKKFSELGAAWNVGSNGNMIDPWTYHARLNKDDVIENGAMSDPYMEADFSSRALSRPYRYGLLRHAGMQRTPVSVALPEYDTDAAPGLIGMKQVKRDPDDFLNFGDNDIFVIESPEGKAIVRDLVAKGLPLTEDILKRTKAVKGEYGGVPL